MAFIDFASLKSAVSIEQVVDILGLEMKPSGNQLRSSCPACKTTGGRELVVTPSASAFYCFSNKKGGDLIALVAHIEGISVRDAAVFIADQLGTSTSTSRTSTSTSQQEPRQAPQPEPTEDKLEKVAARLLFDHQDVQALGLTPEIAERLGVGYDGRGVHRGRVLFPLIDWNVLERLLSIPQVAAVLRDDKVRAGFMGFAQGLEPVIKFPSNLVEAEKPRTVVPFRKAS